MGENARLKTKVLPQGGARSHRVAETCMLDRSTATPYLLGPSRTRYVSTLHFFPNSHDMSLSPVSARRAPQDVKYPGKPLQPGCIRLIRLLPASWTDPIHCELFEESYGFIDYRALSLAWVPRTRKSAISCSFWKEARHLSYCVLRRSARFRILNLRC